MNKTILSFLSFLCNLTDCKLLNCNAHVLHYIIKAQGQLHHPDSFSSKNCPLPMAQLV